MQIRLITIEVGLIELGFDLVVHTTLGNAPHTGIVVMHVLNVSLRGSNCFASSISLDSRQIIS